MSSLTLASPAKQKLFSGDFLRSALLKLDQKRVELHLKRTLIALQQADTSHLSIELQEKRLLHLAALQKYIDTGLFPVNEHTSSRTPIFRDNYGTLCAMGYVMWTDGQQELVNQVVHEDNLVQIEDITNGPVFDWIQTSGLTQAEAAMVQPTYDPFLSPEYEKLAKTAVYIVFFSVLTFFSLATALLFRILKKCSQPQYTKAWRAVFLINLLPLLATIFYLIFTIPSLISLVISFDFEAFWVGLLLIIPTILWLTALHKTRPKNIKVLGPKNRFLWLFVLLLATIGSFYSIAYYASSMTHDIYQQYPEVNF